jgi:nucleoside-diphosphate-sugar epimerase
MSHNKKILILGSQGSVGSGISEILEKNCNFDVLRPSREELDLTKKHQVKAYLLLNSPDVIIHSAGKTPNVNTDLLEEIKLAHQNLVATENLIEMVKLFKLDKLIHIGSASIYQNFADRSISETKFISIGKLLPDRPYALSKYQESKSVLREIKLGRNWATIILPTVLADAKKRLHKSDNLFNSTSEQYFKSKTLMNSIIDHEVGRQVVCARNVGELCQKIINEKITPGLIHYYGKELVSLNYFFMLHKNYGSKNFESKYLINKYSYLPKNIMLTERKDIKAFKETFSIRQFIKESFPDHTNA